jgi:hypothetical protein
MAAESASARVDAAESTLNLMAGFYASAMRAARWRVVILLS